MTSVFSAFESEAWPHVFDGELTVTNIAGGIPSDPQVAESWLKAKFAQDTEALLEEAVLQVMAQRAAAGLEISKDAAISEVNTLKHLNGFKRDGEGLFIEGRQLKAALKEAVNVAYAAGKLLNKQGKNSWGLTSKGIHGFAAEHIAVVEDRLHLGVMEPTGIMQRFVHTFRGAGIQYEEFVEKAVISFTVRSDFDFTDRNWAMIWLTGQEQGIGASRSQGFGRYQVTRWDKRK